VEVREGRWVEGGIENVEGFGWGFSCDCGVGGRTWAPWEGM
jgi:hypothetical protein